MTPPNNNAVKPREFELQESYHNPYWRVKLNEAVIGQRGEKIKVIEITPSVELALKRSELWDEAINLIQIRVDDLNTEKKRLNECGGNLYREQLTELSDLEMLLSKSKELIK